MNAVSQIALRSGYRLVSPFCAGTCARSADEQAAVLVVADGEEEGRERKGKKERKAGERAIARTASCVCEKELSWNEAY